MTHVRTQIRTAFKDALDAVLPVEDYRVFASRKSAINHVPGKALVDMRFLNDQTRQADTMGTARTHVASLYVRVQRIEDEDTVDDTLDADEIKIIDAILNNGIDWDILLEEEPELLQTNFSDDGSGGNILASLVLRFDVEYRINRDNPIKTIQ
jgi:hypothetical protein